MTALLNIGREFGIYYFVLKESKLQILLFEIFLLDFSVFVWWT